MPITVTEENVLHLKRTPEFWSDVLAGRESNRTLAIKYSVSPGFVSQSRKALKSVVHTPPTADGKVLCVICHQAGSLVIHRSRETGAMLALVCPGDQERLAQGMIKLPDLPKPQTVPPDVVEALTITTKFFMDCLKQEPWGADFSAYAKAQGVGKSISRVQKFLKEVKV